MVFEMGGWRWDANKQAGGAFIESLLLAVAGIYLIVREAKIRRREMAADLARSYSLTQPGPQPRNLQVNQIAAPAPAVKPTFRLSAPVWTGIFLMLAAAGAYTYVQRWDGQLASALLGLCSIGIGGGASVLAIAGAERFRKPPVPFAAYERHGPLPAHVRWKLGSSKRRPFQGMPSFGLVAFLIYFCTAIPLWLLQPLTPMGLNVHLLPQSPAAPRAPGMDPLLVQVTGHHEVCVNWQPVTWTEFPAVVQKELKRRPPNWPVYVEGDPDLDWQWVAMAIDTIRGLHGEVSLLTTWKGLPRKQLETRTTHKTPGTRSRDRR
jgi:biopolymer transport protein ExbD